MGKVTISLSEYKKLMKGKQQTKQKTQKQKSQEQKLRDEIKELQSKKQTISQKLATAKKGKGFFKKAGINIGAAGQVAQINKAINERQQLLKLLGQKKSLQIRKEVGQLQKDAYVTKRELKELQEQERKKLTKDIFDTDDIFGF